MDKVLNFDTIIIFLGIISLILVNMFSIHFLTKSCKMDRNKNILVTLNTISLIISLFILVGLVILVIISNYCIGP
ncbi:MAG: hypothetical protein KID00_10955 [Clostridium argentinense]|uniref:hypothetical protein n=1 Tax=Clostridium butanoliproducens TaxID=2991837 RepID=UPI001E003FBB|nr:hypothetical protein [Clostridium butanoliproducens]MBS5824354.1 hypothetical protein [Clostridium argentinense]MDU1350556.1 hypothetical protein [Clostridium argentinense]